MKYCKLTKGNNQTYGGCQWGENVTHRTSGRGGLCSSGWIHVYTHPLLAVLLNPIHANFTSPNLWLVRTAGKTLTDKGLKVGKTVVTSVKQVDLPVITTNQRVAFAIMCAQEVYDNKDFRQWALKWLSGEDCTTAAAWAARAAAWAAAWAAEAAWATWAATAAAWAAEATRAARAAWATWAATAAAWAAEATPEAADLDLIAIAKKAKEIEL